MNLQEFVSLRVWLFKSLSLQKFVSSKFVSSIVCLFKSLSFQEVVFSGGYLFRSLSFQEFFSSRFFLFKSFSLQEFFSSRVFLFKNLFKSLSFQKVVSSGICISRFVFQKSFPPPAVCNSEDFFPQFVSEICLSGNCIAPIFFFNVLQQIFKKSSLIK